MGLSQNSKILYEQDSRWFFSIGGGAAWHTTDIKTKVKFGFTAELGYSFFMKPGSPISLDLGLRYLNGTYEGNDYGRNDGIQNNLALNGIMDTNINYAAYPGYSSLNFRSSINDISLEFQLNTNKLRERTGWNFFLFGSVGFSFYKTLGNLTKFDIPSQKYFVYDYDSLLTNGMLDKNGIKGFLDDDYESALEGSQLNKVNARFTPSIGIGFSYQVAPRIAIGLEHRTTFTLTDLFDGNQYNSDNTKSSNKDLYHYTGVFVRFHFKNSKAKATTTGSNSVNQIDNFTANPIKPEVDIFDPADNPYTTDFNSFTIKAVILNIEGESNVTFKQNGAINNNFTFDPSTHRFESDVVLTPGQNVFEVRGTNTAGTDAENRIIILESSDASPPIVSFNNPSYSPYSTSNGTFQLSASVLNVSNPSDIKVELNGQNLDNFNFNVTTHILTLPLTLNGGPNTVVVTGTNAVGTDSKSTVIVYEEAQQLQPPVVNFLNPGLNPFSTQDPSLNVIATVLNVGGKSDVGVKVNGQMTNSFSYDGSSQTVNLIVNLSDGTNVIEISGTNSVGFDSKSTVIIKKNPQVELPPIVNFIDPNANPTTVYNASYNVIARVENVTNSSQIELKINGVLTSNFTFSASSKMMTIQASLSNGANIFEITATNNAGQDSKNTTIILEQVHQDLPPVVNFSNPSVNPFEISVNNFSIVASVLNVDVASQISVTLNGNVYSNFNFNPVTKIISFPVSLIVGSNVIQISATNTAGSDSKSTILIYKELVQGNPPIVTITSPSTNTLNVNVNTRLITATVLNVSAKSQIQVQRNGLLISPYLYSYDVNTKQLVLNANLVQGNNIFEISATNQFGFDSKQTIIIYKPITNPCDKPIISFQEPSSNPFTTNTQSYSIKAQLLNVANSQNITLRVNGQITGSFNFNTSTKILTKTVNLSAGTNIIQLDATNSCGAASSTTFISFTQSVAPCFPPTITAIYPNIATSSSTSKYLTIKANIAQIANAQNITLKLNGQNVNFTFDAGTKMLIGNVTLNTGNNQVVATAQNECGNISFTWNVYHSTCETPVVFMNNPTTTQTSVSNPSYVVSATISEIQNSNNIQFKRNGQSINFIYSAATNSFTSSVNLISGVNNFELIAQNQCGNDTKQFTVTYTAIQTINPPTVDITNPVNSPFNTSVSGMAINAILDNVASSSQITVLVNGSTISNYNYNPSSGNLSFYTALQVGNNLVKITAVNQAGSDDDQTTIVYNPPVTINPPLVVFTSPTSSPQKVAGKSYTVKGYVKSVSSANQVVFKLNGQTITNYYRNFTNDRMEFSLELNLSNANSLFNIHVTGTNQSGTHSDYKVVEYDLGTSPMGTPPTTPDNDGNGGGNNINNGGNKNIKINNGGSGTNGGGTNGGGSGAPVKRTGNPAIIKN